MATNPLDVDQYLKAIGQFGAMQKTLVLLLVCLVIPSAYQVVIMNFIGDSPTWRCVIGANNNNTECTQPGEFDKNHHFFGARCSMERSSWEYTKEQKYSIVTEWDLVCNNQHILYISNSMLFVGWLFGGLIAGWVSDRYGRKKLLFISYGILLIGVFAMSYARNIYWMFVLRFITGICVDGVYVPAFILATEMVGVKYRSVAGIAIIWSYIIGFCLTALQSWLIPDWRFLMIILSAPYIVLIAFYRLVPESIRWLRLHGRIVEAEEILKKIAKINNKALPNGKLSIPTETSAENLSAKHLFLPKKMAISSFTQALLWIVINVSYYGLSLASDNFDGDFHLNFILVIIVEFPASILSIYLLSKFGRRRTICGGLIVCGASLIAVAFIPTQGVFKWIRLGLGMFGKFSITLSYSGMCVWSAELYPTIIRSQGMGFISVAGRLGGIGAPWIAKYLSYINSALPFLVMGISTLLISVLCFRLRETKGLKTAETTDDINDSLGKHGTNGMGIANNGIDVELN